MILLTYNQKFDSDTLEKINCAVKHANCIQNCGCTFFYLNQFIINNGKIYLFGLFKMLYIIITIMNKNC